MNAKNDAAFWKNRDAMASFNKRKRRVFAVVAASFAVTTFAGCGSNAPSESAANYAASDSVSSSTSSTASAAAPGSAMQREMQAAKGATTQNALVGADFKSKTPANAIARKIIYTATLSLVVEELSSAQKNLANLVRQRGGYIAETNVGGSSGSPRNGTWKVRVPVEQYESFMAAASALGELQNVQSNSDDVSAEFYDVEARIKNKKVEEARLIQLLKNATGKLREILEVEKEISRVRGEIEQMQGRLRVLSDLTSLTTITISMNEIKNYVPPAPPTFGTEIARSFNDSIGGMATLGKNLLLALVAFLPWIVVLALPFALLLRVLRRRWTHINSTVSKSTVSKTPPDSDSQN